MKRKVVYGVVAVGILLVYVCLVIWPVIVMWLGFDSEFERLRCRASFARRYASYMEDQRVLSLEAQKGHRVTDMSTALLEIEELGRKTGVSVTSIKPGKLQRVHEDLKLVKTPFELRMRCSEPSLVRFIEGLGRLDFLCRVVRLSVRPDRKGLKCLVGLEKLDLVES